MQQMTVDPQLKKKILIIEDDESVRRVLATRLSKMGYIVSQSGDGDEGLYTAKLQWPDLIILDLKLPGVSGEQVCKPIREDHNERFANTPILMLTGKS